LPSEYIPYVHAFLEAHPNGSVFVATDSPSFLSEVQERWPQSRVRYQREVLRMETNIAFSAGKHSNYRKGEEVLLDMLLLSRCDFLLHAASGVAEFAIYFNPKLHHSKCFAPLLHHHRTNAHCNAHTSSQIRSTCSTRWDAKNLHGRQPSSCEQRANSANEGRRSTGSSRWTSDARTRVGRSSGEDHPDLWCTSVQHTSLSSILAHPGFISTHVCVRSDAKRRTCTSPQDHIVSPPTCFRTLI